MLPLHFLICQEYLCVYTQGLLKPILLAMLDANNLGDEAAWVDFALLFSFCPPPPLNLQRNV